MKSNYEEKKQARIEAYQRLAVKSTALSASLWKETQQMSNMMNGQPILVGHHSEGRHRRGIEKMHSKMSRSVEADKKAGYYEDRAEAVASNKAISSDDPDALQKLKDKLARLQEAQELWKQINAIIRKKVDVVVKLQALGMSESTAIKLTTGSSVWDIGIPKYRLTNNNGNMARIKERIAQLEKISKLESSVEEGPNSLVKLVVSVEDNRVQLFFQGKPSEQIRKELKGAGFHWAPSVSAWMRQISEYAIHLAKQIANKVENDEVGMFAQHG